MTFKEMFQSGQCSIAVIDEWVDLWHKGSFDQPLKEFLGLTDEEYQNWLVGGDTALAHQLNECSEPEYKEGICPLCGNEIEYGLFEVLDDGGVYEWTCPACGASGEEGYNLIFDGNHYNVQADSDFNSPP